MKTILIDTDVILDFFFDRRPFSDDSAKILSLCESKAIKGYVTSAIISNIYYLLRKTAKHEKVIESLKSLLSFLEILTTDKDTVLEALNSSFNDFEDALQNYSAETNGDVQVIVTRNIKDYKSSSLGVMTPDIYLQTMTSNQD